MPLIPFDGQLDEDQPASSGALQPFTGELDQPTAALQPFTGELDKPKKVRKDENYGNEGRRTPQPGETSSEAAGRKSGGLVQAGLGMLAGLPSTIAGGIYGLGALTSGQGIDEATRRLHAAQESNFGMGEFKPWTQTGQQYSEALGAGLNKPVEMVQQGTENLTGSPAAGAVAGGIMAAGMQFVDPFLGFKGMKAGAGKIGKMMEKSAEKPMGARSVDDILAEKNAPPVEPTVAEPQGPVLPNRAGPGYARTAVENPVAAAQTPMEQMAATLAPEAERAIQTEPAPTFANMAADLSRPTSPETRAADTAMADRQAAMEQEMRQRVTLEQNARLRAQQEAAPTTSPEMAAHAQVLEQAKQDAATAQAAAQAAQEAAQREALGSRARAEAAQRAVAAQEQLRLRQVELEQAVKKQTVLDNNAAERARQAQAPQMSEANKQFLAQQEQARLAAESAKAQAMHQTEIDATPHVNPDTNQVIAPQYGAMQGVGRLDENGMPIRADLSMEAQNLQNPLQRGLWGDELPAKPGEPIGMTQALDTMQHSPFRGDLRDQALEALGAPTGARSFNQRTHGQGGGLYMGETPNGGHIEKDSQGRYIAFDAAGKQVGKLESNMSPEQSKMLADRGMGEPAAVSTVGVSPDARGTGVGRALYDAWRADHGDNVMPSGQTTADAWKYWKRNAPEKVEAFVKQEAERAAYDPRVLRSITDDTVRRQVAEAVEQSNINSAATTYQPGVPVGQYKKQGGWIKLGSDKEPALNAMKRVPGLDKDLAGFATEPLRGEEFIKKYANAADVQQNVVQKGLNLGTKSMDYQAQKTRNPLVKVGAEEIKAAFSRIAGATRELVHDGYARLARSMSKSETTRAWETLEKQRIAGKRLTPDELEQTGHTKAEREFILNHAAMMDHFLQVANEALVKAGHEPMSPQAAHTASKAVGNFRKVMYKTVDGEKVVAGSLGADTRFGLNKMVKQFQKHFPDTEAGPETTHMSGGRGHDINGMLEAINFLGSKDPVVAEFNKRMQALSDAGVANTRGFQTHTMEKKGVPGMPGNRPWESGYENAKAGIEAQIAYFNRVIQMSELAKANETLKPLLAENNGLDMPTAKAYVRDKLDAALGRNDSQIAKGIQQTAAGIAKATGIGTNMYSRLGTEVRQLVNMKLLGLSPSFLLGNIMDPIKGMPGVTQYLKTRGVKVGGTGLRFNANALLDQEKLMRTGGLDTPLMKGAVEYAETNHVYSSDLFEHSNDVAKSFYDHVKDTLQYVPGKIETGTRQNVFFAFVHMLDERSPLKGQSLYEAAHKATDMVMNTYTTHDTPAAVQNLGGIGKLPYNLMSYKANQLSKMSMLARDIKTTSPSTWKPLAMEILTQTALGGIKGMIGYQEADFIVRQISQLMGSPTSLSEMLFQNRNKVAANLPVLGEVTVQDLAHGIPSAATGVDMSNAMGIGNVIPDMTHPADIIMPGASALGQAAVSGYQLGKAALTGDPLKYPAMKAAVDILPGGRLLLGAAGKAVPGVGRPFFTKDTQQGLLGETLSTSGKGVDAVKGGVLRTPADIRAKNMGMTGVHESEARQGAYEEQQIQQYWKPKQDDALKQLATTFLVDNKIDTKAIADFKKAKGDLSTLPREIDSMVKNQALTQQQAMMMKAALQKNIMGAESLQRMRAFR